MTIAEYLFKFSLSLGAMYIFYRVILRPLTFYQWNRFFLLVYSLLAFVLPFLNIDPWLSGKGTNTVNWVSQVPAIDKYTLHSKLLAQQFEWSKWVMVLIGIGSAVMLVRIIIQYASLKNITKNAELMFSDDELRLYGTVKKISPFSFGNSIYINKDLHTAEDLDRIIQHEIVHVRQKHTVDMLLGEILCMINWFNPFAWLIRSAIRQNLEFIADNNVLAKGHDKKEYQYLLLKVVGVPQYSLTNNFNLPHLKKRIAMMNKMKTARIHLAKFLFAVPLLVLMLFAFRTQQVSQEKNRATEVAPAISNIADTVPDPAPVTKFDGMSEPQTNSHGYIVTLLKDQGEAVVVVRDKTRRIVKLMSLSEWNKDKRQYEKTYGKITVPPPPPPPVPPVAPTPAVPKAGVPPPPPIPATPNSATEMQEPQNPAAVPTPPVAPDAKGIIMQLEEEAHAKSADKNKIEEPLYIVDEKEVTAEQAHAIEPEQIDGVIVTKGKAAGETYGVKGKNGVVKIYTIPKSQIRSSKKHSIMSVTVEDTKTDSLGK